MALSHQHDHTAAAEWDLLHLLQDGRDFRIVQVQVRTVLPKYQRFCVSCVQQAALLT